MAYGQAAGGGGGDVDVVVAHGDLADVTFILRADNHGEGGIIALLALVRPEKRTRNRRRLALVSVGLFGASLLYGDGMITPAISVMSAVEGLEVATPVFGPYVVPITIVILAGLFLIQRRGTARIGALFGPITLLWLLVIAALGIRGLLREPGVLAALDPLAQVVEQFLGALERERRDDHVAAALEGGRELNAALARHPKIFSPLFVSLVRVGENTGHMDQAFAHLEHRVNERGFTLLKTAMGLGIAPVLNGQVLTPEAYQELDEAAKAYLKP